MNKSTCTFKSYPYPGLDFATNMDRLKQEMIDAGWKDEEIGFEDVCTYAGRHVVIKEVEDGQRQREPEHTETAAWPDEQLQPYVPSIAGSLGERTDAKRCKVFGVESFITNDTWISNLRESTKYRDW